MTPYIDLVLERRTKNFAVYTTLKRDILLKDMVYVGAEWLREQFGDGEPPEHLRLSVREVKS